MEAKAIAKGLRISPIRARLVADLIRGKSVQEALTILSNVNNKSARLTKKVLDSAIANAVNNNGMDINKLYVSECFATQGPTLKRVRPRAQGRAFRILKRTSHITLVVKEVE